MSFNNQPDGTMNEEPEEIECEHCGASFDPDQEGSYIDGIGDVCGNCEYEAGTECALCGKRYGDADKYWSGLIVANHEFAAHGRLWVPGFYRHEGNDFYMGSMIGAGHISEWALLFAGTAPKLPETSGYVCMGCGGEAAAAAALYYGGDATKAVWLRKGERCRVREMEKRWMRAALEARPELLQEHECGSGKLADFWEYLGIAPLKTWTEYTVIDYKGVRVYSPYKVWNEDVSWLTMDPTPGGRDYDGRGGVFDPSYLPGYLTDWWGRRYYWGLPYVRKALRHAIDHGHLRDGVLISSEELKAIPPDWEFRGREARREWESVRKFQLRYALIGEDREQWQSQKGALGVVFSWWNDDEKIKKAEFLKGWRTPFEGIG